MAYIKTLNVLNTVTVNGTDVLPDSNGNIVFSGGSLPTTVIPAKNIQSMTKSIAVTEQLEVYTITPTYVADATYTLVVQGYSRVDGTPMNVKFSVTADGTLVSADATGICTAFRTQISNVGYPLNIVGSGSTTLVLTASGIGTTGYTNLACFVVNTPSSTSLAIVNTTDGIPVRGSVTALSATNGGKYQLTQTTIAGGYAALSNLATGSVYTEWDINYIIYRQTGSNTSFTIEQAQLVLLIKESATNIDDLQGTNGTLTGLKAGYSTTISAVTTAANKAAAITVTTGVLTLSGSDSPTFSSEDIRTNDIINIGSTYSRVQSVLTVTTAVGTTIVAVSADAYRVVKYRAFSN